MDVCELCPQFDVNQMTSNLAARLVSEAIASIPI
jgi:arginase family enzyme